MTLALFVREVSKVCKFVLSGFGLVNGAGRQHCVARELLVLYSIFQRGNEKILL